MTCDQFHTSARVIALQRFGKTENMKELTEHHSACVPCRDWLSKSDAYMKLRRQLEAAQQPTLSGLGRLRGWFARLVR